MWTATSRAKHSRAGLRFSSDLTDAEWAVLQPLLPPRSPVGRRPSWPVREIVNAIFYVLRGGVPWRMLPPCFPPRQTVYGWFAAWRDAGVWQTINHHLVMLDRERSGREASPTAAVVDSQSVKTTEAGGPRGYDAGKKIKGRKRHAMVDTDGRALTLQVHPARRIRPRRGWRWVLRGPRQHDRGFLVTAALVAAPAPWHLAGEAAGLPRLLPVRAQHTSQRQSPPRRPHRGAG